MRRAAVSVPSNIVEACARDMEPDCLRFLDTSYGSARELEYQVSLAHRLGYLDAGTHEGLAQLSTETCKVLDGLIRSLHR
jgi:four helix bundle protein